MDFYPNEFYKYSSNIKLISENKISNYTNTADLFRETKLPLECIDFETCCISLFILIENIEKYTNIDEVIYQGLQESNYLKIILRFYFSRIFESTIFLEKIHKIYP